MKWFTGIVLIAQLFLQFCSCQADDYYIVGYKLYLLNNGTYTLVDILAQSDSTKLWGALNQMHFMDLDQYVANEAKQQNATDNSTTPF